jgi:membrane-bound lytic murein transglycosylase D
MLVSAGGKKAGHNVRYHTASAGSKNKVAAKKNSKPVVLASSRNSRS